MQVCRALFRASECGAAPLLWSAWNCSGSEQRLSSECEGVLPVHVCAGMHQRSALVQDAWIGCCPDGCTDECKEPSVP